MRRVLALGAILLALAACSTPAEQPPPASKPPVAAPSPAPPRTVKPAPAADSCGAAALQHLVGRPRSEIPIPVDPARQRVACTSCPVTMDFSPSRLNFFFDAATGVIKEIRCG